MSQSGHNTRAWVEIDLPALDRNVGRIKQALPKHIRYVADRKDSVAGKPVFNRTVTLRDAWQK